MSGSRRGWFGRTNVRGQVVASAQGDVVLDGTVLDKNASLGIEWVRRQYSGNVRGVIKNIGVVTCVYVNPAPDQLWLINNRIYDPQGNAKNKRDHVREMLTNMVHQKQSSFQAVQINTRYAVTKALILWIEQLQEVYCYPLEDNRRVDDSGSLHPYGRLDSLQWSDEEPVHGKRIKLKGFPKDHKVRLFRVGVSTTARIWLVTNDPTQDSTAATQQVCSLRWKNRAVATAKSNN